MSADTTAIDTALAPLRQQLQADGYDLVAALGSDDRLEAEVVAGPEACAECLIPKDLMTAMLTDQVTGAGITVGDVALTYPADH
ncbi:MAG: hypothetical protein S0880_16410 [Actinomycetota bacterium]|nr:hypothetical protein [Actinomycetota bacterium]